MSSVVDLTEKNVQQDRESVARSNETIEKVMSRFKGVTTSLTASSMSMQKTGENIRGEISDMLVSLQFQDRVTQILEHVMQQMGRLEATIGGQDPADLESWLSAMEASYTTNEERVTHGAADDTASANSSITFF